MKRGVLCVIDPPADSRCPRECLEQVRGLVVTTVCDMGRGYWDVAPSPTMTPQHDSVDRYGSLMRGGMPSEVLVPEHWLRPIRGDEPPSSSTTDTTERVTA